MVFVKDVFGIVLFVQEGQRQRRLGVGIYIHTVGTATVVLQKLDDIATYPIVACLTNESILHATTSQGNQGIERRTAWYSSDGLVIAEDNVKHRLTYSYNFSHNRSYFARKITK